MGGTWMGMVYGTAGMRDYDGRISFNPHLGRRVDQMSFNLIIRGQRLSVAIDQLKDEATYLLKEGSGLTIEHQGTELELKAGEPITQEIRGSS